MFTELKKRFAADPHKKLAELVPELRALKDNLNHVARHDHPLNALIAFFNITSPWQDRGLTDLLESFAAANYKHRYDATIATLNSLGGHFRNAGRERYEWNRTEKGQTVTYDNVFLGNIYGLFTHPAAFWLAKKDEQKGGWGFSGMEYLNPYDVVSNQAKQFMNSHIEPMTQLIDGLEAAAVVRRAA